MRSQSSHTTGRTGRQACVVSVNASRSASSDGQLREAAVQLSVLGLPLHEFDPWGVPSPFKPAAADPPPVAKKRSVLSLSAATFVSPRTTKAREAAMADGKRLTGQVRWVTCVTAVLAVLAAPAVSLPCAR